MYSRRKNVGIYDNNTNNHLEGMWQTLKDYLKQKTSKATTIFTAVLKLVRFCKMRLEERFMWDMMKLYVVTADIRVDAIMRANGAVR